MRYNWALISWALLQYFACLPQAFGLQHHFCSQGRYNNVIGSSLTVGDISILGFSSSASRYELEIVIGEPP